MVIGFDFGNENLKTSEGFIEKALFTQREGLFKYDHEVIIDGQKYIVGEGNYDTELDKSSKATLLPALCVSLANSTNKKDIDLVLGLPMGQYKVKKDELIKTVSSLKTLSFIYNDKPYQYNIGKVLCYPEGLGAFADLSTEDRKIFKNTKMIILDIGGRTTEIALMSEDNKRKILKHKSLDVGMINIYSDIVERLNEAHTITLKIEDAERIIKHGLYIKDKEIETKAHINTILKDVLNDIIQELNINFSANIYPIFLTGGGGKKFYGALKRKYGRVVLSKDFLFANANGFKKYGIKTWRK